MIRNIWWLGCGVAVAALALMGCDQGSIIEPDAGAGTVEIYIPPPSMDISDVTRIEITITGSGIPSPIVAELAGSPATGWSGILSDIPAGLGRTFVGRAYDASGVLYEGSAYPVTIQPGGTSLVTLFMHEINTPSGYFNSAPRITALVVSAYTVAPGGTLAFSATAVDPDGDPLTWAWSSPAGAFDDPTVASVVWTAPAATGSVLVRVGASDPTGATATLDLMITVGAAAVGGSAYVAANLNSAPEVASVVPSPSRAEVGRSVYLDLTASDSDGDALTYSWSSSCEGSYDDPTMEDPSFTLDAEPADGADCLLRVRVADERGGSNVGEVSIASGAGVCGSGPCGPTIPVPGELIWDRPRVLDGRQSGGHPTVGADGTTFVMGAETVGGIANVLVERFAANGDFLGRSSPAAVAGNLRGGVVDPAGNLYAVGTSGGAALLMEFTGGVTPGWTLGIPFAFIYDVALSPTQEIVVTGLLNNEVWLATFGRDGAPATWNTTISDPAPLAAGGVAVDLAGNMIVCGTRILATGVWDPFLAKYTPDGERLWIRFHDLGASHTCEDVEASGSGDLYVAGKVRTADGSDLWLGRFDAMGNLITSVQNDLGNEEDIFPSLAVASDGSVYVAARWSNSADGLAGHWLGSYTPTLLPRWSTIPALYRLGGLALHPDGTLMLGGILDGGSTDDDLWLGKFAR